MELLRHHCIAAHANRLANRRLHAAIGRLPADAFHAPRTGFFPSFALTLNHLLAVDGYYLDAIEQVARMAANYEAFVPAAGIEELAERQRVSDERLIRVCGRLAAAAVDPVVVMDRGAAGEQRDRAGHVLAHLFMHQTHHRGQAHAMLSGTGVEPPQLDEFLMPSDAPLREADMRALGWREDEVFGG